MGSSCFSRGNKQVLQRIQKYLKDHQLERDVILKGNHCFGDCSAGPVLTIGAKVHEQDFDEPWDLERLRERVLQGPPRS